MPCNTCGKSFSFFRKECGCPGCGFSYCTNCLKHKVFLPKLKAEAKVCIKCFGFSKADKNQTVVEPPSAYIRRLETLEGPPKPPITVYEPDKYQKLKRGLSTEDQRMVDRLRKLHEDEEVAPSNETVEQQITERLKKLRGLEATQSSNDQVEERLSKLKGETVKPGCSALPPQDLRSDQEKSDDLLKQYMEEAGITARHKQGFDESISNIESRLQTLTGTTKTDNQPVVIPSDSEDEEDIIRRLVERAKAETALEAIATPETDSILDEKPTAENAELPWCEICNEDAKMRCLGCRYLYCKQCYHEHKDDDEECSRWEPYEKPNNARA